MTNQSGSPSSFSPSQISETDFEKQRGISRVEVRTGLTQVHVLDLKSPIAKSRLKVLDAVSSAGISLDFLKLTPTGLSFIVPADNTELISATLNKEGIANQLATGRGIVLVHAVNMRDEEGMIAGILRRVIETGITVDHASDMHDRILIVTDESQAERFKSVIEAGEANV
jgi:aspartate kinase